MTNMEGRVYFLQVFPPLIGKVSSGEWFHTHALYYSMDWKNKTSTQTNKIRSWEWNVLERREKGRSRDRELGSTVMIKIHGTHLWNFKEWINLYSNVHKQSLDKAFSNLENNMSIDSGRHVLKKEKKINLKGLHYS